VIVNKGLLFNPLNWLIVVLMLIIAGMGGHYLLALAGITPSSPAQNS
jgi:hypothetical protein